MKLVLLALGSVVAVASAAVDPADQPVQLCGARLAKALKRVCEDKDVDFLLQHGQYNPEDNDHHHHCHQHEHSDHHHHGHHHERDDHHHVHHHDRHHDQHHGPHRRNHTHSTEDATKYEATKNGTTLAEQCCIKPCLVKDFMSYCA